MKHYIVHFVHTDMKGWQEQLVPHLIFLKDQIKAGHLLLSGPSFDTKIGELETRKEATLVFRVENKEALENLIKLDPYWSEGLVSEFQITEWNPMFGMLGASAEQIEEHLAKK